MFMGTSGELQAKNALQHFLNRQEPIYSWNIKQKQEREQGTLYHIRLVSQTWKNIVWTHQLSLFVPPELQPSTHALLFISGGSNKDGEPKWDEGFSPILMQIACATGRPVTSLRQVPNQPLYDGKTEDALISMTFLKFLETEDPTWPLLFPMVKSAVKAMDAIQDWSKKNLDQHIEHFVVAGASKQGWTTWLTGASDPRVSGIGPMVIDTLNMGPQMEYQIETWGKYSDQIKDYSEKNIPEKINATQGKILNQMVDPYAYRDELLMPKMIFVGTNDANWPLDAIKNYFDDLKGQKYIHYVPNAGHDLGGGEQAGRTLGAFFDNIAKGRELPDLTWELVEKHGCVSLHVLTDAQIQSVNFWYSTSKERDFRNDKWDSQKIESNDTPHFQKEVTFPQEGFKAFYIECVFPSPLGGTYSKCTRVYVLDQKGVLK